MADHPLYGCHLKLKRAHQHLHALHGEIATFFEGDPYSIEGEMYEDFWRYQRLRVKTHPPLWWGIIVGDIAHNARSALDQLVWQLVLANRREPGIWNQFPVFSTEPEWDRRIEYGRVPKRKRRRTPMLRGVRKPVQARVKELQPFQRQNAVRLHPLTRLAWLNNVDKHQTIHPGYGVTPVVDPDLEIRGDASLSLDDVTFASPRTRHEDGAYLARYRILNGDGTVNSDPEVDVYLHFPVEIAFGWRRLTYTELQNIILYVEAVLWVFGPVFDGKPPRAGEPGGWIPVDVVML